MSNILNNYLKESETDVNIERETDKEEQNNSVKIYNNNKYENNKLSNDKTSLKRDIFIDNICFDLRENDLYDEFSKIGKINRIEMSMRVNGNINVGYALIEFDLRENALYALKYNDTELLGRIVKVKMANIDGTDLTNTILIVGMPLSITKENIKKTYGKYGKIKGINYVKNNADLLSEKSVLIEFYYVQDAKKAAKYGVVKISKSVNLHYLYKKKKNCEINKIF